MEEELPERDRLAAVIERFESQVTAVAEGHVDLVRAIHEARGALTSQLSALEGAMMQGFGKVWDAVDQTHTRLDQTGARIEQLVARFDTHEQAHSN